MVDIEKVKKLRQDTGVSLMECRKALEETNGDIEKAQEVLRKKGQELLAKRAGRETGQGLIDSYIHSNKKIGVLLDIRSETDFVARSSEFQELSKEICLQIAAMNPLYLGEKDIPDEVIEKEKEIYREQILKEGKDEKVADKIIEGKIEKYKKEVCLFSQTWVKDDKKTIQDLFDEYSGKIGENIVIKKFARFEIGQ